MSLPRHHLRVFLEAIIELYVARLAFLSRTLVFNGFSNEQASHHWTLGFKQYSYDSP